MTTWYIDGENTHGEPGLFCAYSPTAEEIAEMNEPTIGQMGPDYIVEGTADQLCTWLHQHGCTELETDDVDLSFLWKKRNN